MPTIQKLIISTARRNEKGSITATQMMESMIENSSPTRA
ncbi:pyruvate kinase, partial [Francisella tularensis]